MKSIPKIIFLIIIFAVGFTLGFSLSIARPAQILENQAVPLNDRDYFPTLLKLIESANLSIDIMIYSINYYPDYPDSPSNLFIEKLGEAAGRGVSVRVITDQTPTEKPVLTIMKDNGIDIKYDSMDTTTHAKLIIIDSKIVIIGSTNWSYYSIEKNHEANVLINSKSLARSYGDYFERIWFES